MGLHFSAKRRQVLLLLCAFTYDFIFLVFLDMLDRIKVKKRKNARSLGSFLPKRLRIQKTSFEILLQSLSEILRETFKGSKESNDGQGEEI